MSAALSLIKAAAAMPQALRECVQAHVLMVAPLRIYRDHKLDELAEWDAESDDPGWLEQMVRREGGFDEAFAYFEGKQFSGLCEELQEFDACCALVAEIELSEWQRQKARAA